jgi:uncharacterized protein
MPKLKTSFLVDINVWLAIAYDLHVHHEPAAAWFETIEAEQAFFCRLTQLGLLRLLTNSRVMGADTMSQSRAWQVYDKFLQDPRVSFFPEPEQVDANFRQLTRGSHASTNLWTDAYLAAVAKTGRLAIVSLDRAFSNIPGVEALVLPERHLS